MIAAPPTSENPPFDRLKRTSRPATARGAGRPVGPGPPEVPEEVVEHGGLGGHERRRHDRHPEPPDEQPQDGRLHAVADDADEGEDGDPRLHPDATSAAGPVRGVSICLG